MTWKQERVFNELRWFWDEGQKRRRYYRERPQSSRVEQLPSGGSALAIAHEPQALGVLGAVLRVFGLPPDYTADELRIAHRRLVLEHHPDRGGDVRTMQAVNDAAAWLRARLG